MTIKLLAMYTQPENVEAFLQHYRDVHMPLVMKIPGLQSATVNRIDADIMGGEAPYFLLTEMVFPDRPTFDAAMASPENRAAGKDAMTFAKGLFTLLAATEQPA